MDSYIYEYIGKLSWLLQKHNRDNMEVLLPKANTYEFVNYISKSIKHLSKSIEIMEEEQVLYDKIVKTDISNNVFVSLLNEDFVLYYNKKEYDLVILNLKYIENIEDITPENRKLGYKRFISIVNNWLLTYDIENYIYYIVKSLIVLKPYGILCLIIPDDFLMSLRKYRILRKILLVNFKILDIYNIKTDSICLILMKNTDTIDNDKLRGYFDFCIGNVTFNKEQDKEFTNLLCKITNKHTNSEENITYNKKYFTNLPIFQGCGINQCFINNSENITKLKELYTNSKCLKELGFTVNNGKGILSNDITNEDTNVRFIDMKYINGIDINTYVTREGIDDIVIVAKKQLDKKKNFVFKIADHNQDDIFVSHKLVYIRYLCKCPCKSSCMCKYECRCKIECRFCVCKLECNKCITNRELSRKMCTMLINSLNDYRTKEYTSLFMKKDITTKELLYKLPIYEEYFA